MMKNKLHILCHALGRDEYGQTTSRIHDGKDWRNHFSTGVGSVDFDLCRELVAQGLMVEHQPSEISGGDHVFVVTAKGVEFIAQHAPKPPKLSKSKQRYQRFREYGDGFKSFREFLTWDTQPERSWNQKGARS